MEKKNMRIKKDITIADQIAAINYIMDYYLTDDEYTPYYAGIARAEAIAKFFIEGVTFDENEYVYDCIEEDDELRELVQKFYFDVAEDENAEKHNKDNEQYINIMQFIVGNVNEKLEFEKQKRIHCTDEKRKLFSSISSFVADLDKSLGNIANLELSELTPEIIEKAKGIIENLSGKDITSDTLSEVIKNAVDFKVPDTEIYKGQKEEIGNLKKMLNEERKKNKTLEKTIVDFNSRNVVSDK